MTATVEAQILDDFKAKLKALTPQTKWRGDETFRITEPVFDVDGSYSLQGHMNRAVFVLWDSNQTEFDGNITMGAPEIATSRVIVRIHYLDGNDPSSGRRADNMAQEDAFQITKALQALAGYPSITGGQLCRRRFNSMTIERQAGFLVSTLSYLVDYR